MRWLVVLLLALPVIPAQGGALDVTIQDATFDVAPEAWKNQVPPTEETPEDDLDVWSASLGLHLDVTLEVRRGGNMADAAWTYQVTLSDGAVRVPGLVTVDAGRITARFDVDGQRAHAGLAAVQPLSAGDWTVQVRAEQGTRHEGTGSAVLTTHEVALESVGQTPEPGIAVPEDLIPHVRELGPGPNTWMPMRSMDSPFMVTLRTAPGETLNFRLWLAVPGIDTQAGVIGLPVPSLPDPFALTPVAGNEPTEAATAWIMSDLGNSTTPAGNLAAVLPVPNRPAWAIYTIHGDHGGMVSFVVPVHGGQHDYQEILATPGMESPVSVTATGPIEAPLATLYAIAQDTPGTTGSDRGARLLSTGTLLPAGDEVWRGGYDGAATRASGASTIALLAMFQDLNGTYAGHIAGLRGIQATLDATTLGVDRDGTLTLALEHAQAARDAALSIPVQVTMDFAGQDLGQADMELAAGGTLTRAYPLTPTTAGAQTAQATLDTGDLRFQVHKTFQVLDRDAYDDATAPWYDVPGPALPLLLAGFVLLALRKREI